MRRSLLIACLLAATPALADDKADKAKAKQLYEEGKAHYDLAEYKEAIAAWKQTYLLSKKPILLFNIAQAYRLSGDCTSAMTFYDSYTREEPSPKNQDELDQAITLCKDKTGKPHDVGAFDSTKPDTTKPDTTKPDTTKPDTTKLVDTHTTTTTTTTTTKPNLKVSETTEPDGEDHQEPVDTGPGNPGHGKKLAGMATGAVGLVLGGVGIYFALDAKKQSDALDGFQGQWTQEQKDIESKGKGDQTKAYIFGGLGVGAIIAGGVLYVLGSKEHGESHVAVAPTHGGAAVGYTFSW